MVFMTEAGDSDPIHTVTGITFNSKSFTSLAENYSGTTKNCVYIWYLKNPGIVSGGTIAITSANAG